MYEMYLTYLYVLQVCIWWQFVNGLSTQIILFKAVFLL